MGNPIEPHHILHNLFHRSLSSLHSFHPYLLCKLFFHHIPKIFHKFFHKYFQNFADGAGVKGMPNFLRKFEVVEAYEKLTGNKLRNIDWYITYGLLHQAVTEVRITQRRILFGEIDAPQSPDDYLFTQHLIRQVLDGQSGLWD